MIRSEREYGNKKGGKRFWYTVITWLISVLDFPGGNNFANPHFMHGADQT